MKFSIDAKKVQAALFIIVVFALSISMVVWVSDHPENVEAFLETVGIWAPLVSIGLYVLLGMSPIPSEALSLINGAVFGPVQGTLIGFAGNMAASLVEYWIGTHLGNIAEFEDRKEHLPFGLGRFPAHSVWFLLFARMIPGVGGKLVSITGGIYRVPMWRYLWTAAIPTLIGTAIFVLGGFGLMRSF